MDIKNQVRAAIEVTMAYAKAIRELKEVPNGHLYTRMMGHLSLDEHNRIIQVLKDAGVVTESNYLLKWVGPGKELK